ncbi:MAG: hypothetical protein CL681_28635 [Blastopirellula sp.]|nr:hypothetical protein [Blastopirellula sp.]
MQKYFTKGILFPLPSGNSFHPSRCIIRDGTITWRDALQCKKTKDIYIPVELSHEQHIIKTAQRLEELNTWLMQPTFELHDCLIPYEWFNPTKEWLSEGISAYVKHNLFSNKFVLEKLAPHVKPHEELELRDELLFFKRC